MKSPPIQSVNSRIVAVFRAVSTGKPRRMAIWHHACGETTKPLRAVANRMVYRAISAVRGKFGRFAYQREKFLSRHFEVSGFAGKGHRVVGAVEPVAAPGNARRYASNISSPQATASRARSGDGLSEKGY